MTALFEYDSNGIHIHQSPLTHKIKQDSKNLVAYRKNWSLKCTNPIYGLHPNLHSQKISFVGFTCLSKQTWALPFQLNKDRLIGLHYTVTHCCRQDETRVKINLLFNSRSLQNTELSSHWWMLEPNRVVYSSRSLRSVPGFLIQSFPDLCSLVAAALGAPHKAKA